MICAESAFSTTVFGDSQEHILVLEDVDSATFGYIATWLYRVNKSPDLKIPRNDDDEEKYKDDYWGWVRACQEPAAGSPPSLLYHLANIYNLAQRFNMPKLQNHMIDDIHEIFLVAPPNPVKIFDFFRLGYEKGDAKLKQLAVDGLMDMDLVQIVSARSALPEQMKQDLEISLGPKADCEIFGSFSEHLQGKEDYYVAVVGEDDGSESVSEDGEMHDEEDED